MMPQRGEASIPKTGSNAGSDAEERERGRVARVRKAEEHGLREVPGCMAAECCPGASELRDKQAEEGADEEDAEAGDEAGTLVREVEQREEGRGQDYGKGRASRDPECPPIEGACNGRDKERANEASCKDEGKGPEIAAGKAEDVPDGDVPVYGSLPPVPRSEARTRQRCWGRLPAAQRRRLHRSRRQQSRRGQGWRLQRR